MSDEDLIEAIRAASGYALHREAARRVLDVVRPKGFRVVPEEARTSQVNAGMIATACRVGDVAGVYTSMVAAAPPPPLPKIRDDDPMRETFA